MSFKVAPTSGTGTPTGKVVVTDGLGDTCTPSQVILNSASAGAGSCMLTITTFPGSGSHADGNVHSGHECLFREHGQR